ncbi:MAG: glycosyltransferase family 2 protein [Gammaproteobacteria bacterium]
MSQALSVVIITQDEITRLPACFDSVAFAAEILVIDSGSTDGTQDWAREHGARVIDQPWLGYGPQKQFGVQQATNDWVLCIDADERVSPALAESIQQAMAAPEHMAYRFPRCNRFLGRWLRHGEGYPDLSLRLFHREHARWGEESIHEAVHADGPEGLLNGDLLHESQETLAAYLKKQNRYTSLQAEELIKRGKQVGTARMLFSPLFRFIKFYFIRRGFMDGMPGLVHILIGCMNSFVKYAKVIEKQ